MLKQDFEEKCLGPYSDYVYRFCMTLCKDPADAEDLSQKTWLIAFEKCPKLKHEGNLKGWLSKIAKNLWINEYRRRQMHSERVFDNDLTRGVLEAKFFPDPVQPPDQAALLADFSDAIYDALAKLPPQFRQVHLKVDWTDLPYKVCAEEMDIPVGTVMSRLHRGRKLLKEELATYAAEEYGFKKALALANAQKRSA
jgi:RNA polymerase sigma-70 factor (ECF subfamily)